ncbi:MAG: 50S ribosomal protein L24 [Gammaproteobacteria bacterium]|jgi:large subunit ribosomal protein L24|nr:50S ribosomal protein L24 [Gammaproteobacteria bacterium]NBT44521.1 50S ribosomal protein L24 [Gammaproteobacteria bacterium]NBY21548.1 50S ribosomal protein L24 [Gammaproteobacteria bacterium]NDE33834.1 50S ribosomal protein L24 [Gammaproteobacteria bacterium]NDE55791.1 50S ribosomal protein L24 [Gammaproteobacteria bacterium]
MRKIKRGDQVVVITGKDKGKRGPVLGIPSDEKLVIEGVNIARKHQKPNPMKGISGGIVEKAMPIHISNVALVNPATNQGDKVGFKLLADGRKVRFFKSNNEVIDA